MATIDTAKVQQYKDNVVQLVQQKTTKLKDTVMVDYDFVGEYKFVEQLGPTTMVQKTTRNQITPAIDPDHRRRRISKDVWIHNILIDRHDKLDMLIDPTSPYSMAASMAAGRKIDDMIIAAYSAVAYTGKTGSTSTTFDANFQIAIDGTNGLTTSKLLNAKRLLDDQDVEEEDRTCVATSLQIENLLKTTEVTSSDYNTVNALVNGTVNNWIGFKFKRVSPNRLPLLTTHSRGIYCYHKAAVQLSISQDPFVQISERPDLTYSKQVYLELAMGAVRLEEERIVQIACYEA